MPEHLAAPIKPRSDGAFGDKSERFRVIRPLGAGGAAEVFLALARGPAGFQKLVVLKQPRTSPGQAPVPRSTIFHEARLAARLNHPNCAQVIGIEEINGVPVIVLEYLEGLTLAALRNEAGGKVPLAVQLSVLHDALLGLHHAHQLCDFDATPLGIVHRDVSPQNILVTYDGEVKVLDFGIAKANRQSEQTEVGVIKGKFRYMAPEQVNGSPMDARTDVFAAGIILWEALTGQRIWSGMSESKLLQMVLLGHVPPVRSMVADVPELLEKVCERATASRAEDRFQSAQEMALALAKAARELGLPIGRELLASYLDAHYRETRLTVRAQIESELADATFQAEDSGVTTLGQTSPNHVSIAPELSGPTLPDDSLDGSTVPPRLDGDAAANGDEAMVVGSVAEARSSGLLVGAALGLLACAVALLALNRFAPEPARVSSPSSFSPAAVSPGKVSPASVTPDAATVRPSEDGAAPPAPEGARSVESLDRPRAAPLLASNSSASARGPASSAGAKQAVVEKQAAGTTDASVASEPAETAPVVPDCAVPFELTPDGFKRFKPECLTR